MEWVAYPFPSWSFQHKNRTGVSCIAGRFFTSGAVREDQEYVAPSNTLYKPASLMEGQWDKEQWRDRMVLQEAGGMRGKGVKTQRERTKYPAYCPNSALFRHSARTHTHTHTHVSGRRGGEWEMRCAQLWLSVNLDSSRSLQGERLTKKPCPQPHLHITVN